MTIRLPVVHCFGEHELGPGPALALHVLSWHMDSDYSYCRVSEMNDHQVKGLVFS